MCRKSCQGLIRNREDCFWEEASCSTSRGFERFFGPGEQHPAFMSEWTTRSLTSDMLTIAILADVLVVETTQRRTALLTFPPWPFLSPSLPSTLLFSLSPFSPDEMHIVSTPPFGMSDQLRVLGPHISFEPLIRSSSQPFGNQCLIEQLLQCHCGKPTFLLCFACMPKDKVWNLIPAPQRCACHKVHVERQNF